LWLHDKLRLVEAGVKGRPNFVDIFVNGEQQNQLKYSLPHRFRSTNLQPLFARLSTANPPLCRRISTAFSTGFSLQIRSISAGFSHREAAGFFRIFFAAIAQEIADSSEEKDRKSVV
jgi:hypothetical protein